MTPGLQHGLYAPLFGFGTGRNPPLRPPTRGPGLEPVPHPPPPSPGGLPGTGQGAEGPVPNCPAGTEWDPYVQACVAVGQGPSLSGNFPTGGGGGASSTTVVSSTPESSTAGEGPITINVQNAVNVADQSAANAVQSVASAVSQGIQDSTQRAAQIARQSEAEVASSVTGLVNDLSSQIKDAQGGIVSVVSAVQGGIASTLGDIGSTIGTEIANNLNPVSDALAAIVKVITGQLGGLAGAIGGAVANVIPLIVAAIQNPLGALTGVLGQIESDIGKNLRSLVQIPGAIADSTTSIDATLGRIFTLYAGFTENQSGYPDGGNLHFDLSSIWKQLAGIAIQVSGGLNPKPSDHISSVCGQAEITELLNKPWIDWNSEDSWINNTWKIFFKGLFSAIFYLASILPAIRKSAEELNQRLDQACPIEPLPVSALVDAVLRGILTQPEAVIEAAKGDTSETRFQILKDLATHQMSPESLVQGLYRSIISRQDVSDALAAQGWTPHQVDLATALGVNLLTVSEALELSRRGTIDQPTLDKILSSLAYDDAQRKALASLTFRPPNFTEAVSGGAAGDAFTSLPIAVSGAVFTPPEDVERAAAAEGLDHDATVDRWLNHWNTGSFNVWTNLYFRGQIPFQTLQAFAGKEFIPSDLLPAFIEAQRPLVQFRTISTALRAKIITDDAARVLLRQHGYSDANIDLLIAYAHRPGAQASQHNAPAQHAVSLGIAKEEYIDGSISADQLLAILTQHGFTVDGANTELQVINAHQALLRRKENAQLVIDEFGAGLIDEQNALAQLALLGLTVDELARAAHKIRAFRAKAAKHPTEAELHNFLKLNLISDTEYVAELRAIGYSQKWAGTFLEWRKTPAPSAISATSTSASPPSGP